MASSDAETFDAPALNGHAKRTLRSKTFTLLREEPRTNGELKERGGAIGVPVRRFVERVKVTSGPNTSVGAGRWLAVYFLYGDARRGIRRFIDVNHERVRRCMESDSQLLANNLDGYQYRILQEEWYAMKKAEEAGT